MPVLRRVLPVAAVAVAAASVAAADARAWNPIGPRWGERRISYHLDSPEFAWSLEHAVRAWNTSGARIRFVPASGRARVIVTAVGMSAAGSAGLSTRRGRIVGARVQVARNLDRFVAALVLAHELGHALGLDHDDRRCATMNTYLVPDGTPAECAFDVPHGAWLCRLLQADDVRGAVALYGGRPRPRGHATCFKWAIPGPVEDLQAGPLPARSVELAWTVPASEGVESVEIRRGVAVCPTSRAEGLLVTDLTASSGEAMHFVDETVAAEPAGEYCYAVFAIEEAGRAGPPGTIEVAIG